MNLPLYSSTEARLADGMRLYYLYIWQQLYGTV